MNLFNSPNHSGRTMALRFTQPLTEMSTRNLREVRVKGGRRARLTPSQSSVSRLLQGSVTGVLGSHPPLVNLTPVERKCYWAYYRTRDRPSNNLTLNTRYVKTLQICKLTTV
jgi:hypothetical protein